MCVGPGDGGVAVERGPVALMVIVSGQPRCQAVEKGREVRTFHASVP